jgi:nucleoside phosphorylase
VEKGRLGTARVGVLTIIDEEFEEVRTALRATEHILDSPHYADRGDRIDVVVRQAADRSNVPAMAATLQMIEAFRPDVISVVGIAGGVSGRNDVALGDIVVADYLHYAEFLKRSEAGDLARYFAYDQPTVSLRDSYVDPIRREGVWHARIPDGLRPTEGEPKVVIGSIVAGERSSETRGTRSSGLTPRGCDTGRRLPADAQPRQEHPADANRLDVLARQSHWTSGSKPSRFLGA